MHLKTKDIVIIGAGPAGLGCTEELLRNKYAAGQIIILEKNENPGGLARSFYTGKYFFDLGPHRFYTKNASILTLWKKILGKKLVSVRRSTHILYKNRLFEYPIKASDVLWKLEVSELYSCLISYIYARFRYRNSQPKTFEDWIIKHFGKKLYEIFFKTYTEKVWGIPCNRISAKWASQRIRNLNLLDIIKTALFKRGSDARSLIKEFYYPIQGSGYLYDTWAKRLQRKGVTFIFNSSVNRVLHDNHKIKRVEYIKNGKTTSVAAKYVFTSMPITKLADALFPSPPQDVKKASKTLYYRDHITVNLLIEGPPIFLDQWLYIHDQRVKIARVTNYKNFVPTTTAFKNMNPISVEYFVFQKDPLWKMQESELFHFAIEELKTIQLIAEQKIHTMFIKKETESYPVYYLNYEKEYKKIKGYINQFDNLRSIGRAGMYKYNNMDHSILSGQQSAKSMFNGNARDIDDVNNADEYVE